MTDQELRMFLFGLLGSVAVEVVNVVRAYENRRSLAARYRSAVYVTARVALALIAGGVTVAFHPNSDLLCIHVGAATPAIIQLFSNSPPP